jgi:hypothetical protein
MNKMYGKGCVLSCGLSVAFICAENGSICIICLPCNGGCYLLALTMVCCRDIAHPGSSLSPVGHEHAHEQDYNPDLVLWPPLMITAFSCSVALAP